MAKHKKILVLENDVEASLMESILNERKIPHIIKSYRDSAYDGLYQHQKGWGYIEAPENFEEEIKAIYRDLAHKE
ncbi:MAG: hypothetical protein AMJ90_02825 [candidate division Zixibacteria bacterium SM23_73_2]|nr:MAG: hypothetical protein AMJ90_02825 [candidate division Zixibacteria bacterium SM23_73_2]